MEEFVKVLGDKPNQWEKQVDGSSAPEPVAGLPARPPITEGRPAQQHQRRHPLPGLWLAGNGCVPIHNLMEDALAKVKASGAEGPFRSGLADLTR